MSETMQTSNPAMPAARAAWLESLGHGFLEGRREGVWVWDTQGKRYFDAVSGAGTFNLGRRHPDLAEALRRAMRETDQGNFPMVSIEKTALAEALAQFVPGPLDCSVFSVMRGEAIEFACKVARGYTGRAQLVGADGGWYGQTGFALTLSEREDRDLYGPLIPETARIPFGDLDAAAKGITSATAAVIIEPVQAENHCRTAPPEYFKGLEQLCRDHGALLVFDETQTNFGRTGSRFAFESCGVSPDLLVLGEALGGGMFPIAVTMLTQQVNRFMNTHPLIHMSTFGGTDVGCRVAAKALELYGALKPWENAVQRGGRLLRRFEALAARTDSVVRGVRGGGLLFSLDLGDPLSAKAFCRNAAEAGLLVLPGEVARHTVVIRPSLLLNEAEAEFLAATVETCA